MSVNIQRIEERSELLQIAAAYQNQLCLIDIANDYEEMMREIHDLRGQIDVYKTALRAERRKNEPTRHAQEAL